MPSLFICRNPADFFDVMVWDLVMKTDDERELFFDKANNNKPTKHSRDIMGSNHAVPELFRSKLWGLASGQWLTDEVMNTVFVLMQVGKNYEYWYVRL
jgi:hypothetical protein